MPKLYTSTKSKKSHRRRKKSLYKKSSNKPQPRKPGSKWYCYLIASLSENLTYVGKTNDVKRRLKQHNGRLSGGAKYTQRGRPWKYAVVVSGFQTEKQALQFEWRIHKPPKRRRGLRGRLQSLLEVSSLPKWTCNSPLAASVPLTFHCRNQDIADTLPQLHCVPAHISIRCRPPRKE